VVRGCKIYRQFPKINAKFDAFARTDGKNWTTSKALLAGVCLLGTMRYLIAWICVAVCVTLLLIGMIGADTEKPHGKVRASLIYCIIWLPTRVHLLMSGCFWINF
jgi:hypothetical protein